MRFSNLKVGSVLVPDDLSLSEAVASVDYKVCMLTYADVCWRMLTYADVR